MVRSSFPALVVGLIAVLCMNAFSSDVHLGLRPLSEEELNQKAGGVLCTGCHTFATSDMWAASCIYAYWYDYWSDCEPEGDDCDLVWSDVNLATIERWIGSDGTPNPEVKCTYTYPNDKCSGGNVQAQYYGRYICD